MTNYRTTRFAGVIGFVPKVGGSLLNSPNIQQIIQQFSMGAVGETYKTDTSMAHIVKSGVVDSANRVKVELKLKSQEARDNGYNENFHKAFAAFLYVENGRSEVIEIREIDKTEFDKYEIPVTFHSIMDIFSNR